MEANEENTKQLKKFMDDYYAISDQLVSKAKFSIFSVPILLLRRESEFFQELYVSTEALSDRYLRLPSMVGAYRSKNFTYLIERVSLISGWK
jgi:hypothetical protein